MYYSEALNFLSNPSNFGGVRRKNWKKGNYIAFNNGEEFTMADGIVVQSKWGYYTQDGKSYPTLEELLSSEGIKDFKDDGEDSFETLEVITVYLDIY